MTAPITEPVKTPVRGSSPTPEGTFDLSTQLSCLPLGRLLALQREWKESLVCYNLESRRGLGAEEIYLDPNLERGLRLLLDGQLFSNPQDKELTFDTPVLFDLLAQQAISPFLPNGMANTVVLTKEELFKKVCENILPGQSFQRIARDLATREPVLKCGYFDMSDRAREIYNYHQQLFHRAYELELLDAELQRRSAQYRHQYVRSIDWIDPLHEPGQFLMDVVSGIRDKSNLCLEDTLTALAIIDKYQIPWASEKEIAQFKIDLQKHVCSFQERKIRRCRKDVDQASNPDGPFAWYVNNAYNYAYSAPGEQSNLGQTAVSFLVEGSKGSRAVWFTLQKAEAKWEEVKKSIDSQKSLPQFLADYRRYSRELDSCLAEISSHLNINGQSVEEWAKIDQSLTATMLAFATVASLSKGDAGKAERALNLVMTASAWNFTLDAAQQWPTTSYDFGRGADAISDGAITMASTLVPELRPAAAATTTLLPEYLAQGALKRKAGQVLMDTGKRWAATTTEAGIAGTAMGAANGYKASLTEQTDPLTAIQNITIGAGQGAEGGLLVGGLVGTVPPAFKGLKVTGARLARDARSLPRDIRAAGTGLRNAAAGTRSFFDSSADKLVWWLYGRDFPPIAPAGEVVPGWSNLSLPKAETPQLSSRTPTRAELLPASLRGKPITMSAGSGSNTGPLGSDAASVREAERWNKRKAEGKKTALADIEHGPGDKAGAAFGLEMIELNDPEVAAALRVRLNYCLENPTALGPEGRPEIRVATTLIRRFRTWQVVEELLPKALQTAQSLATAEPELARALQEVMAVKPVVAQVNVVSPAEVRQPAAAEPQAVRTFEPAPRTQELTSEPPKLKTPLKSTPDIRPITEIPEEMIKAFEKEACGNPENTARIKASDVKFGVYQGDELVGFVAASSAKDCFFVEGVYVAPTSRGQGFSHELIYSVVKEARTRGFSEVKLDTMTDAMFDAMGSFKRKYSSPELPLKVEQYYHEDYDWCTDIKLPKSQSNRAAAEPSQASQTSQKGQTVPEASVSSPETLSTRDPLLRMQQGTGVNIVAVKEIPEALVIKFQEEIGSPATIINRVMNSEFKIAVVKEGETVGFAAASPFRNFLNLDAIYVPSDLRRQGLGDSLLLQVVAEAKRRGLSGVQISLMQREMDGLMSNFEQRCSTTNLYFKVRLFDGDTLGLCADITFEN